jgi:hypothetical protein
LLVLLFVVVLVVVVVVVLGQAACWVELQSFSAGRRSEESDVGAPC